MRSIPDGSTSVHKRLLVHCRWTYKLGNIPYYLQCCCIHEVRSTWNDYILAVCLYTNLPCVSLFLTCSLLFCNNSGEVVLFLLYIILDGRASRLAFPYHNIIVGYGVRADMDQSTSVNRHEEATSNFPANWLSRGHEVRAGQSTSVSGWLSSQDIMAQKPKQLRRC